MISLGQAIRRHRESSRREREIARAYRSASGSDMRTELQHLVNYSDLR
jgi:hypothetical protein